MDPAGCAQYAVMLQTGVYRGLRSREWLHVEEPEGWMP